MQFKNDKQQKKEKSTKQDIEITRKAENNHKRHITGKKCADKNIKGPGILKKKENKMENLENSKDENQHGLQNYS